MFRFVVHGSPANFGVAVLSGRAVPHVVLGADENRLAGYPGLPIDLNPYREQVGESRQIAGAVLPASGVYSIVFDTRSATAAGSFTFRFWIGDTTPPKLQLVSTRGAVVVSAIDSGSGVDPQSVRVTVDGHAVRPRWNGVELTIPASRGRHKIALSVGDYQEAKNMEDVPPILPNTARLATTVTVR